MKKCEEKDKVAKNMKKMNLKTKAKNKRFSFIIYFLLLVVLLSGCGETHRYRTIRYYTPDWSPDGTHIACIEEIYEFDRKSNPGALDPRGEFNEKTVRKLIIYNIATGESKAYDYGGYYHADLDWYPGTDILLADGSENLKILRMNGNEYVSTDSMKIADSKGILRARWNYDHSLIAVRFREDTAIWIVSNNGNPNLTIETYDVYTFIFEHNDNLLFFRYKYFLNERELRCYNLNTRTIRVYKFDNDIGDPTDWLSNEEILLDNYKKLNISDSTITFFQKRYYKLQTSPDYSEIIAQDVFNIKLYEINADIETELMKSIYEERID